MAAPAFDSAGAGSATETSGASHDVVCPATVAAGDLLVAHLLYEGLTIAPTDPSGWSIIDPSGPRSASDSSARTYVYGKIAAGTEGGTTIGFGSPANANARFGRIYRFTGVRSDTIGNVVGGWGFASGAVAQIDDTGVTTPEADCLAVNLVGVMDDNAVASFTGETGGDWTEAIAEFTQLATTPDCCLQIQTATMASAGTINGGTQTMAAADPWSVIGFYIRGPAAASGSLLWNPATPPTLHLP